MDPIKVFLVSYLGLMGLVIGSFLNVVVWRLPRRQSIVHPPSACPKCSHRLGVLDLVPVFSWIFLRGKCRYCGAPIASRYPVVEGLTGIVFAGIGAGYGVTGFVVVPLALAAVLIPTGLIELDAGNAAPRHSRARILGHTVAALAVIGLGLLLAAPRLWPIW